MERPIPYWLLILIGALLFIGFGATMAWVTWARPAMVERSWEEIEPTVQDRGSISDLARTRPGVDDSDISIGDLVIYGDGFETAGSFMEAAILARNAWIEYSDEHDERPGSYLIRNAQRTVKPCEEDAKFVRRLSDNTYRLDHYRIIVLSRSEFEPKTIEGIGFYPILSNIDQTEVTHDILTWYRCGNFVEEES